MPRADQTRSNSLNSGNALTFDDVKTLISQSEERILSRLDTIMSSISVLEKQIDSVQSEQIRLGLEMSTVKDIIIKQQMQIEKLESDKRQMNLVFSNVPENAVEIDDQKLEEDIQKLEYLCEEIDGDFTTDLIDSHFRIGPYKNGQRRLLLVRFNNLKTRNRILFTQRAIRDNPNCRSSFGPVYVNKDSTVLVRKEEKRLREKLKDLKSSSDPGDKFFIKSGKLYRNSKIVDEISIANQIF